MLHADALEFPTMFVTATSRSLGRSHGDPIL